MKPLVSHTYPLEKWEEAFDLAATSPDALRVAINPRIYCEDPPGGGGAGAGGSAVGPVAGGVVARDDPVADPGGDAPPGEAGGAPGCPAAPGAPGAPAGPAAGVGGVAGAPSGGV
ncbi:MAG: hypothetical protein HY803_03330 [candidate division NC10 bacterium]|nr:hypothetical protein [candidate division NC10 bacterium]